MRKRREMSGGRRRKVLLSKIYALRRGKAAFKEDYSQIGGPGFTRVVFCNESEAGDRGAATSYGDNYVSTTKYTLVTFFPKSLFEQFRRVANFFFLLVGCLSFTPLAPYSAVSAIIPLVIVIGVTMVKEAVEDWRRKKQVKVAYIFCANDPPGLDAFFLTAAWLQTPLAAGKVIRAYF